ncbi:molybdenum ABC transporter ATP-binding protein [Primorskyibacter sp. S187A]|uniref:molybdenum ABC transporter ATP-binding protein n=1 Tax=Primorskyibacter sp. S187A TaxID=3415130 RepID=UPI003C7C3BD7
MSLSVRFTHRFESVALDIAFDAPPGVTCLFGPSGSGKTSVIRAVAGLLRPDQGEIRVQEHVLMDAQRFLPPHKRGLGYVFQDHRLFPHLNVAQNLAFGARYAPKDAPEMAQDKVVDMLGIGGLLERRPSALSGGEAARVAIGRALLARPRMILADEPLASLDGARKAEILPYFEMLRDEVDIPVLYVTHAMGEVARLATTVVALEGGRVQKVGPALAVLSDPMVTPAGPRAAGAVIEARLVRHHADGLSELEAGGVALFLPAVRANPGAKLRVRIAAQDVILSSRPPEGLSALNVIPAHVLSLRTGQGPGALVSLQSTAGRLLARVTARSAQAMGLAEGHAVWAVVKSVSVAPEDVGQ